MKFINFLYNKSRMIHQNSRPPALSSLIPYTFLHKMNSFGVKLRKKFMIFK